MAELRKKAEEEGLEFTEPEDIVDWENAASELVKKQHEHEE